MHWLGCLQTAVFSIWVTGTPLGTHEMGRSKQRRQLESYQAFSSGRHDCQMRHSDGDAGRVFWFWFAPPE